MEEHDRLLATTVPVGLVPRYRLSDQLWYLGTMFRNGRNVITTGMALLALMSCDSRTNIDPAQHASDVSAWRTYRYDLLHKEGWLVLTGLFWLEDGPNTIGGGENNHIVLTNPGVPEQLGLLSLSEDRITMIVQPGANVYHAGEPVQEIVMQPGSLADATVLTLGSIYWHIIGRQGRYAVRVRDSLAESLLSFDSIPSFPVNGDWRFDARFDRYDPPKTIGVPSVLGNVNQVPSPGAVVFSIGLKRYRLDVTGDPDASAYWIQFGDETNGIDTYGGGRYLWVDAPNEDGRTIVDFNKSYNPPCVFTPYATCPLPPAQNKLPLTITAGELEYPPT